MEPFEATRIQETTIDAREHFKNVCRVGGGCGVCGLFAGAG